MKKWPIIALALLVSATSFAEDKEGRSISNVVSPTAPGQVLGTFDGTLAEWETIAGGSGNCHIVVNGPGSYTIECPGYTGGGGGGPPGPGSITDAMLASAYSGVGPCPAGEFVNILNRNAAPGCATPAGGPGGGIPEPTLPGNFLRTNLGTWVAGLPLTGGILTGPLTLNANAAAALGAVPLQQVQSLIAAIPPPAANSITDAMLANAYSGVGTCGNGEFVFTLNRNAPPTCEPWQGGGPAIGPTPPPNPFAGDLWINTSGSAPTLEIYDGIEWIVVSNPTGANTSPTPPANPLVGEIWYDSTTTPAIMKMWDGSAWVVAGGEWAPITNPTGGINNYAPIAGPVFTGVPTAGVFQTSSNNVSQILFAPVATQQGSITSGTTIGVFVTQGARYASGAWTSTNTVSTAIGLQGGNISFYSDPTVPILTNFTPTLIGRIGPNGTDLPGPLTINGAPVGNFAPLTNPAGGQNNYAPIAGPTFTGTARFADNTTIGAAGSDFGQRANFGSGITVNFGLTSTNQSNFQGAATFNSTVATGPITVNSSTAPGITITSTGFNAVTTSQNINAGEFISGGVNIKTLFSGIGPCTAGQFVSGLNANGAPTCATPAGGNFAPLVNPAGGQNNYAPIDVPVFTGKVIASNGPVAVNDQLGAAGTASIMTDRTYSTNTGSSGIIPIGTCSGLVIVSLTSLDGFNQNETGFYECQMETNSNRCSLIQTTTSMNGTWVNLDAGSPTPIGRASIRPDNAVNATTIQLVHNLQGAGEKDFKVIAICAGTNLPVNPLKKKK